MNLNLDAKFSLKITGLYLDFIKLTFEKVDSQNRMVPNVLKRFPKAESSVGL